MRVVLLFGLLSIVQLGFGQKYETGTLQQTSFTEEIEFRWIKGKLLIPVQIGGNTYQFILDTGGGLSISKAIQDAFQFEQIATAEVVGVNKLSRTMPYVKVPEVKLGRLSFTNYNATVSPHSGYPYECLQYDGIIGRDFLKDLILAMDLEEKKVILTDEWSHLEIPPSPPLPLKIDRKTGLPYIKVEVKPFGRQWLVFDSGSDDLFSFKTQTLRRYQKKAKFRQYPIETFFGVTALGASGVIPAPTAAYTAFIEKMEVGGVSLNSFYTDISKRSRSRIGTGLLKYGRVVIDYRQKQFYFLAKVREQEAEGMLGSIGFLPRYTKKGYIVGAVQAGSEAEEQGLQVGDVIVQLNDINMRDMEAVNHCDVFLSSYGWADIPVTRVTILRDGEERKFSLTKVDY